MKAFNLTLTWNDPDDKFKFKSSHKIEADSLLELLSQFMFVIVKVNEDIVKEAFKQNDNTIPF